MKKLLLGCLLLCSVGTYAEETHELPPIQGWWPDTQSFSSLVSGVVQPQVNNGMTPYGTNWSMVSHAQMVAAQEAAKKAAAAAKAAKKQQCVSEAKEKNNTSFEDVSQRLNDQRSDCQYAFAHEPEAMAACTTQAYGHYSESIKGLDAQQKVDEAWCEKQYGG
jgi:hypothetical protein